MKVGQTYRKDNGGDEWLVISSEGPAAYPFVAKRVGYLNVECFDKQGRSPNHIWLDIRGTLWVVLYSNGNRGTFNVRPPQAPHMQAIVKVRYEPGQFDG